MMKFKGEAIPGGVRVLMTVVENGQNIDLKLSTADAHQLAGLLEAHVQGIEDADETTDMLGPAPGIPGEAGL